MDRVEKLLFNLRATFFNHHELKTDDHWKEAKAILEEYEDSKWLPLHKLPEGDERIVIGMYKTGVIMDWWYVCEEFFYNGYEIRHKHEHDAKPAVEILAWQPVINAPSNSWKLNDI